MDREEILAALTALAAELDRHGVSRTFGDRLDPAARFFVEQVFAA